MNDDMKIPRRIQRVEADGTWNEPPEIPEARSGIWSGIPWVHLALGTLAGLVTFLLLDLGLNLATGMRTWMAVFMGSLVFWVAEACFDP